MKSSVLSQRQPWPLTHWPGTLWNTADNAIIAALRNLRLLLVNENTRGNWKASMAQSWLTPRYSLSVGNLQVIFAQKMGSSKPREEGVAINERWRDESVAAFHSLQVVPPHPSQQSHPTQTCCSPKPFVRSSSKAAQENKSEKSNLLRMLHLTGQPSLSQGQWQTHRSNNQNLANYTKTLQTTLSAPAQQSNTSRVTIVGEQLCVRFACFIKMNRKI